MIDPMDRNEWFDTWKEIQGSLSRLEKKQPQVLKGFEDILREERTSRQSRDHFLEKTKKKQNNIKLELAGIQKYIQDVCSAVADPKSLQGMLERFEAKLADYKLAMRTEYTSLIEEEEALVEDLSGVAANVGIWENERMPDADSHSHRGAAGDSQADSSRIKERQNQMLEFHAKIGALDRKVRSIFTCYGNVVMVMLLC
jgi:hypothetical protein